MPTRCLLSQEPSMYSVSIQWSIDDAFALRGDDERAMQGTRHSNAELAAVRRE